MESENWMGKYINELIGTFILILLGNGAIMVAVYQGGYDLYGVGIMWGFGVMFAVYIVGGVSGAHINPAVTLAQATFRTDDMPWSKVPGYILGQMVGAFAAAAALYGVWGGVIEQFEAAQGITRGAAGSEHSAMAFYTFFPNPDFDIPVEAVSFAQAFASEALITALLVGGILALIDNVNPNFPQWGAPALIGLLVAALVAYEAPISMAALNPARDLGPRIFAFLTGWGEIAFPGPRGGWWLPTISTIVGGLIGGAIYDGLVRRYLLTDT